MRKQVRKVGILMKGYGPVNTITSFCRDKCGNFDQNPTASIKSYWEPGYRDTPLFPRLLSKNYEQLLSDWLMPYIKRRIESTMQKSSQDSLTGVYRDGF